MNKQQIIEALQPCLQAYNEAYNSEQLHRLDLFYLKIPNGFCYYFLIQDKYTLSDNTQIIKELLKDLNNSNLNDKYWYPVPTNVCSAGLASTIDREICLKPRIDHLNRTIARLQKEIEQSLNTTNTIKNEN